MADAEQSREFADILEQTRKEVEEAEKSKERTERVKNLAEKIRQRPGPRKRECGENTLKDEVIQLLDELESQGALSYYVDYAVDDEPTVLTIMIENGPKLIVSIGAKITMRKDQNETKQTDEDKAKKPIEIAELTEDKMLELIQNSVTP
jgi:hypothetical protein